MNMLRYLKDSMGKIAYFIILIFIMNLVLAGSGTISESISDIVYLNVLLFFISLCCFVYGYFRWKARYHTLKSALDREEPVDFLLPHEDNLESELIRDIVSLKNREVYDRTKELKNRLDEINDYITMWVHEIKIPISVCEIIADRIGEDMSPRHSNKNSEGLRMELERIKFLINQVLYASRASSYSEDLQVAETSLEKVVRDAVKRNSSFFISKNIGLRLDNLNYSVMTDKKWIAYILDQILNNACKYVNNDGIIEIKALEDEKSVKLCIRDNGIGIAPKDINRIFDRGFTGDNGRRGSKSTGMGMYFSKKMADKLGHDITAASQEGRWTEFTIVFYKIHDYFNVTKM